MISSLSMHRLSDSPSLCILHFIVRLTIEARRTELADKLLEKFAEISTYLK